MKSTNDNLEKILTTIFGALGSLAIIINLFIRGWSIENLLSATKDIAGLIVIIAVFLVANKIFRKTKQVGFSEVFEKHLKDWIDQNKYLIDNINDDGKGKYEKRYCSMMIDHTNILTQNKLAQNATQKKEKGAFVYLPYKDEDGKERNEFEFRFNERTFSRQNIYSSEEEKVDLKAITTLISKGLNQTFGYIGINAKPYSETIKVNLEGVGQTDDNAKKLVDMVEYVKTMVLAIA